MKRNLRKVSLLLLFALVSVTILAEEKIKNYDKEVKELLSKMTVEEKVGQMTQITVTILKSIEYFEKGKPFDMCPLDTTKLRKYVTEHNLGSVMHQFTNGRQDLKEWNDIITQIQDYGKKTRLQIPLVFGIDMIHGAGFLDGATIFPHNIGMAATRNPQNAYNCSKVTAMETRATGCTWNFNPVYDIGRQPLWSRYYETFGEDVHIGQEFLKASVNGAQDEGIDSHNSVATTMKHFVGYSYPASGWDKTPNYIPEIQLREYHLPQYETGVDAGAESVMISLGELNGVPIGADSHLLEDILRGEFGFDGIAVSDWETILLLHTQHKIATTEKEAIKIGIMAGIDMCMVPWDVDFYYDMLELIEEGEVPMSRIDEAVSRILKFKYQMGLFENAYPAEEAKANYKRPEYKKLTYEAAAESMTLLKNNDDILPLRKDTKILLAGPTANSKSCLHGGWTLSWGGHAEELYPDSTPTIKEALQNYVGAENVISNSKRDFNAEENYSLEGVDNIDVIILCLGENAYAETPGGIKDLLLEPKQIQLVKDAKKEGKPIITVLVEGRPRVVKAVEPLMDAVLMVYIPGEKGADAIVNTLYGENNPSGILPISYPAFTGHIMQYDFKGTEEGILEWISEDYQSHYSYDPQWAFGFGLSYTEFEVSDLSIDKQNLIANDTLTVKVKVKNIGNIVGKKAIELYSRDHYASITPSNKRLRAFTKVELKPDEEKTVSFKITADDLKFVNSQLKWVTEDGTFDVIINDMKKEFTYSN